MCSIREFGEELTARLSENPDNLVLCAVGGLQVEVLSLEILDFGRRLFGGAL
jgi:hypothetical protein